MEILLHSGNPVFYAQCVVENNNNNNNDNINDDNLLISLIY